MDNKDSGSKPKMTIEEAKKKLEETISLLKSNTLSMQEYIDEYEKGCKLAMYCTRELNRYQLQFEDINDRLKELEESGAEIEI